MIAGLPPAMGLYAAGLPVILGSLMRGSRVVVTGPVDAVSILIGTATVAAYPRGRVQMAVALAFMVGALQLGAGLLRLGALTDLVSRSLLLGYITGAALRIGAGQLANLTATPGGGARLADKLPLWLPHIGEAHLPSVGIAGLTVLWLLLRRQRPRWPGPLLAMAGWTALSWALELEGRGCRWRAIWRRCPPACRALGCRIPATADRRASWLWPARSSPWSRPPPWPRPSRSARGTD